MGWAILIGAVLAMVALAALAYWQLDLAEGVYLGRRVVIWLYDRFARRYDAIKQFTDYEEARFLGQPLAFALQGAALPLVLDVATGTARLPRTLLRQPTFHGRVVGLDLSRRMLHQAAIKTTSHQDRLSLLWKDATGLPFRDAVFDAVSCLEALEFLPDMHVTLAEMTRVLRPGGIMMITNRVGPGARWLPGRTMSRQKLTRLLEALPMQDIQIHAWQVDYDLVWARKPVADDTFAGLAADGGAVTLPRLLCCPRCGNTPLVREDAAYDCEVCGGCYPIADDGVIEMAAQVD
jgi:ubiquinone/menaquinone biosynthesis C-methylase UbiE